MCGSSAEAQPYPRYDRLYLYLIPHCWEMSKHISLAAFRLASTCRLCIVFPDAYQTRSQRYYIPDEREGSPLQFPHSFNFQAVVYAKCLSAYISERSFWVLILGWRSAMFSHLPKGYLLDLDTLVTGMFFWTQAPASTELALQPSWESGIWTQDLWCIRPAF